jgi:hypothetical protein
MDMIIRHIKYFRGLVKGENEDVTFDWEEEKLQGMREKLLEEVRKYVDISET